MNIYKVKRRLRLRDLKREWLVNPKADILAGAVVGLALIPEAIAFSIIAGVDPKVGLYTSFVIAVTTAFLGGRPGSISAATGAMALLMIDLVRDWGLEYLLVATLLTGVFQVIFGVLKLGRQMRYVPRAVMLGYINA
ncbi:MAG: SulP family inorganic anion transporter, partial [Nodosilinea sp.]